MQAIVLRSEFPFFRRQLCARAARLRSRLAVEAASAIDLARLSVEFGELNLALARIADGSFGTCVECNRPIHRERLQTWPTARHCAACAGARQAVCSTMIPLPT